MLPLKSTGLAGYDAKIIGALRQWKYSRYMIDDQPLPVCTAVTFIYSQDGAPIRVDATLRRNVYAGRGGARFSVV